MPFAVRKLPGEPIIMTTAEFPLHKFERNLLTLYVDIDRIVSAEPTPVYRILDARALVPSYSDILIYVDMQGDQPGSLLDPRIRSVLVGTHPLIPVLVRHLERKLNLRMPLFSTIDDALRYIRAQLAPVQTDS